MKDEFRIYHFGNMYLSSIQQSIQAAHAQTEMALKYAPEDTKISCIWYQWARNNKTMICLNAGYNSNLVQIKSLFEQTNNPYPFSHFYESEEALAGILTNVCIVLPEKIFKTANLLRRNLLVIDKDIEDIKNKDKDFLLLPVYNENIKEVEEILLKDYKYSFFEIELIKLLNSCGLSK